MFTTNPYIKYSEVKKHIKRFTLADLFTFPCSNPINFGAYNNIQGIFINVNNLLERLPAKQKRLVLALHAKFVSVVPNMVKACIDISQLHDTLHEITSYFKQHYTHANKNVPHFSSIDLALLKDQTTGLMAIDFEMFEHKQSILLEVGITEMINGNIETEHYVFSDNLKYKNGCYVPDYRDHFLFGITKYKTFDEIQNVLDDVITRSAICIGHSVETERKILQHSFGINVNHLRFVDTLGMYCFIHQHPNQIGLAKCLAQYNIPNEYHHNGGNDSHRTMMLYQQLLQQ